jgi:hypothetical protein
MRLIIRSTSDTLREGKIVVEQGTDTVLDVLEVDAAVLKARLESDHAVWPEQAPPVDGVIVCCDVSKTDSSVVMGDILRL